MSIFVSKLEVLKYLKRGEFLDLDKFINLLAENNERVLAYKSEDFITIIGGFYIQNEPQYNQTRAILYFDSTKIVGRKAGAAGKR